MIQLHAHKAHLWVMLADLEIQCSKTSLNSSEGGSLGQIHIDISFEEIIT